MVESPFEGLWYQYLEPIRRNAPEDYERILFWFPMLETEILRRGVISDDRP